MQKFHSLQKLQPKKTSNPRYGTKNSIEHDDCYSKNDQDDSSNVNDESV